MGKRGEDETPSGRFCGNYKLPFALVKKKVIRKVPKNWGSDGATPSLLRKMP